MGESRTSEIPWYKVGFSTPTSVTYSRDKGPLLVDPNLLFRIINGSPYERRLPFFFFSVLDIERS